jgi:hypothetical protein
LDGEYIATLKAKLIVKWITHEIGGIKRSQKQISKSLEKGEPEEEEKDVPEEAPEEILDDSFKETSFFKEAAEEEPEAPLEEKEEACPQIQWNEKTTISEESTIKRCYFELQIESDKDFNIKSRIKGAMGWNMKRIEEKWNVDILNPNLSNEEQDEEDQIQISKLSKFRIDETVKLQFVTKDLLKEDEDDDKDDEDDEPYERMRPKQMFNTYFESDTNNKKTYLLVKSRNYKAYWRAVMLVQELLINVYEDYKRYWEKLKKKPLCGGLIKKIESVKGDRKIITSRP